MRKVFYENLEVDEDRGVGRQGDIGRKVAQVIQMREAAAAHQENKGTLSCRH